MSELRDTGSGRQRVLPQLRRAAGTESTDRRTACPAAAGCAGKKADQGKAGQSDVYEVVSGDNLGKIARKFYGDARRFDIIVNANPQLKGNPDRLRVGMKLVIPKI